MGPKTAINLFSIGLGAAALLVFETLSTGSGAAVPFIVLALVCAAVGGIRILQIRTKNRF